MREPLLVLGLTQTRWGVGRTRLPCTRGSVLPHFSGQTPAWGPVVFGLNQAGGPRTVQAVDAALKMGDK